MPRNRVPRTDGRPRVWSELPLIVVVYVAYSLGRLVVRGDVSTAVDNGLAILRLEKSLTLNAEHPLNRLFTDHAWLGVPADFAYASLHYLVTPAILVWLFRNRAVHYRAARTWLMGSTLIGLVGFTLMPTCPPRLLDASHGFVDTMAQYSSYGWWGAEASAPRGLGGMTNQYAAMPSLHVGWSLWCGVMLWRHGRTPLMKTLGVAYPLLTTIVVMGTANHYFLDAVAGAAVMGLGLLLTRPALRLSQRVRSRFAPVAAAASGASAPVVSGGCETSAGERIPHQRGTGNRPADADNGARDGTGDTAATAAR
ncbi:phosphatase PAP2 family protein [Streptomyces sp. E11-3]|uniref:phosphatase PAP2 family protein n=1 Tax=Streptomyces sp. E11-3 TaxID=3110112 RepID=UPI0039817E01